MTDYNYLKHSGKKGQKWYKRFFQSYSTRPTRSGKVGQEYGKASRQSSRLKSRIKEKTEYDNYKPGSLTPEQKKKIGYNRPDLLLKYREDFTPQEIDTYNRLQQNLSQVKSTIKNKKKSGKQKLKDLSEITESISKILQSTYKSAVTINKGSELIKKYTSDSSTNKKYKKLTSTNETTKQKSKTSKNKD